MLKYLALIVFILLLLACRKDPKLPRNTAPSPCSFDNTASLFPNPVQDTINFCLSLSLPDTVQIVCYNNTGTQVAQIVDSCLIGGSHLISYDVSGLSSGTYFCIINVEDRVDTLKMIKI